MTAHWRFATAAMIASMTICAQAVAGTMEVPGKITVGTIIRPTKISFDCDPTLEKNSVGNLGFTLAIDEFVTLVETFDLLAFEGPDSRAPDSELQIQSSGPDSAARLQVSGWIMSDPSTAFGIGASAPMRGGGAKLERIRAAFVAMSSGPSVLTWTLTSPRRKDPSLVATATISAADSERVRETVASCLTKR